MEAKPTRKMSKFYSDFFLGGLSGAISKTVSAPLERVKLLLQTQHSNPQLVGRNYSGFLDCLVRVYHEEGFLAYWRGNWANVIRYFPTTALNFAIKDGFNRRFNTFDAQTNPYSFMLTSLLAGGVAGMGSALVVYPLDFARTRMGVDVGHGTHYQFNSLQHCLSSIVRSDGLRGIYQGIGPSLVSVFTYRSMYFGLWDSAKTLLPEYERRPFLFKFLVAQVITAGSETINYPLDTVRRRMMMNAGRTVPLYPSTMSCIRTIATEEGVGGFYRGCMSNAIRSVSSSLVLILYDELYRAWNSAY